MFLDDKIEQEIERIRQIYCEDVLKGRNREVHLLGRKCSPQILKTFLGYELKLARKRIACPDLVSARYLKVFGEIGVPTIKIPYDPTRTAIQVTGLEHAMTKITQRIRELESNETDRRAMERKVFGRIRETCLCLPSEESQVRPPEMQAQPRK